MRISDWSSDVCSSDLACFPEEAPAKHDQRAEVNRTHHIRNTPKFARSAMGACSVAVKASPSTSRVCTGSITPSSHRRAVACQGLPSSSHVLRIGALKADRKRVVEGKSVSVRLDLGGGRYLKKKK